MSKEIVIGGKKDATVALVVKTKKSGKALLSFYNIEGKGISKNSVLSPEFSKEDLLFRLKFKDIRGVQAILTTLGIMRDRMIYLAGKRDSDMAQSLREDLKDLSNEEIGVIVKVLSAEMEERMGKNEPEAVTNKENSLS